MKIIKILITVILVAVVSVFFAEPSLAVNNNCESDTSVISCDSRLDSSGNIKEGIEGTGIWSLLILALNILTGGVGIAALAGIIYGAAIYVSAGGRSDQIQRASAIFSGVIYGVVAFAALWSLLNFLIPGGVFY